ncbi:MAG: response regulator transcription factor [Bacillota bacterium]
MTPRERDVFRLLALGRTSREIARELYLTHNTAREYVQRIYQKLSVQRRSELISRGVELGYLQVEFYM